LNMGLDPEDMVDGITLAGYHIEKGARTFSAFAKAMIADLGEKAKEIIGMVRQWMRDHGFAELAQYGETDLANLLRNSRNAISKTSDGEASFALKRNPEPLDDGSKFPSMSKFNPLSIARDGYSTYVGVKPTPRRETTGIADSINKVLTPADRDGAVTTAGIIRSNLAEQAHGREMAQVHLEEFAKMFDRMPLMQWSAAQSWKIRS
jgi:hypothetical protein